MREAQTNNYEVTFILGEASTAEQAAAKTKEVSALITKLGGKTEKDEQWGKRDLAYPINKNRSGTYVTMWFSMPSSEVMAFERALRFDESVIRSLVIKAYTTAQPGSLYPVPEEEKPARGSRRTSDKDAAVSAEEELRRNSGTKKDKAAAVDAEEETLSEEDRLKQLDDAVDELLKDESAE
ncbi:MAG TPA: 30S ribosomal protein S6 [Verrucomicrobiae bacterium]|nr:30S ribosomal protein S6 [Verrucomicrobiae bacterium]